MKFKLRIHNGTFMDAKDGNFYEVSPEGIWYDDVNDKCTIREDTTGLHFEGWRKKYTHELATPCQGIQPVHTFLDDTPNSGENGNYYRVTVDNSTQHVRRSYTAECNDIIEALEMNFAEGNAFKALWRKAAARQGNGKTGNSPLYDAQKVKWSGERLVAQETK